MIELTAEMELHDFLVEERVDGQWRPVERFTANLTTALTHFADEAVAHVERTFRLMCDGEEQAYSSPDRFERLASLRRRLDA